MEVFKSKSSVSVKIVTIGVTLIMAVVCFSMLVGKKEIISIIIGILIPLILIYFYSNSLRSLGLTKNSLILNKPFRKITIPLSEIRNVQSLESSTLTLTTGSRGYFGYIGNTMDNSVSLVKDRSKMIKIITSNKHYTLSCENSEKLISEIKLRKERNAQCS